MRWLRSLESIPTIRAIRGQIDALQDSELRQAQRRIENGENPGEVLEAFARTLSRKFAHAPSQALKHADEDGNGALIDAARKLFKLPD